MSYEGIGCCGDGGMGAYQVIMNPGPSSVRYPFHGLGSAPTFVAQAAFQPRQFESASEASALEPIYRAAAHAVQSERTHTPPGVFDPHQFREIVRQVERGDSELMGVGPHSGRSAQALLAAARAESEAALVTAHAYLGMPGSARLIAELHGTLEATRDVAEEAQEYADELKESSDMLLPTRSARSVLAQIADLQEEVKLLRRAARVQGLSLVPADLQRIAETLSASPSIFVYDRYGVGTRVPSLERSTVPWAVIATVALGVAFLSRG